MSILAQLELNEASEVDFGIEIHGTVESSSEIRFIIEGPQYGVVCRCTEHNGVITASIPKLKGIIPAGTFDARLEVVVDGKFFTPLRDSIEFKPLVEFDVKSTKAKPAQELKVETKNVKVRVIENEVKEEVPEDTEEENEKDTKEVAKPAAEPKKDPAPKKEPVAQKEPAKQKVEPEVSWQELVSASITRPDNAPKPEKGDFDYNNVSTNKSAPSVEKTVDKPVTTAPKKKTVDKEKAKELLSKLQQLKSRLGEKK